MSRRTKVYASDYSPSSPLYTSMEQGEAISYSVDWNGVLNNLGTTISASTWTQQQNSNITISGDATASGVASALFTAVNPGKTVITNQVTFADGGIREQKFAVEIVNSQWF